MLPATAEPDQASAPGGQPHELPTWLLVVVIYTGWLALTWFYQALPWWLVLPLAAWFMAWHMSLQHELLHGHPSRHQSINTALGFAPLHLWLPYLRYRALHIQHHRKPHLTNPLEDPESHYVTAAAWQRRGPLARGWTRLLNTLAGRLVLGPVLTIGSFLHSEARLWRQGDRALRWTWLLHLLAAAAVLYWVIAICRIPLWVYVLGFVYSGLALSSLRSFAEHRADPNPEHRTAIVEKTPIFGLLFLHNNLHVVHHDQPGLAWYRLPAVYRAQRSQVLQQNGGHVYRGYADVFWRYLLTEHHPPVFKPGPETVPGPSGSSGPKPSLDQPGA